jgi:transcription antitermination factor NusG
MKFVPGQTVMFDTGRYLGELATVKSIDGESVTVTDNYGDDVKTTVWHLATV